MKREIIVGVTGINAVDNPGPGLGVAKALKEDKELNVKVAGLAYDAMEPGIYLDRYIDRAYIVPYPSGDNEAYLERLAYVKNSYGLDFIIPNLDPELPFYAKYAGRLKKIGMETFLPTPEQLRLRGKDRLVEVSEKTGLSYPESEVVTSFDGMTKAVERIGLPVMVKGAFYKACRAYTTQEAVGYFSSIVAEWGYPVIVQKVVSGDEMNVVGVGDGDGSALGLVGIKKIWVTSLGKIWTGVTIKNEKILEAAEKFVREYNWKGPFELECIDDKDKTYLIEINPSFPAS